MEATKLLQRWAEEGINLRGQGGEPRGALTAKRRPDCSQPVGSSDSIAELYRR